MKIIECRFKQLLPNIIIGFQQILAQNAAATSNDTDLWQLSIDFLAAFNSARPIQRLIALYEDNAEPRSNIPLANLCRACSELGIFLSASKISSTAATSYLHPDHPPVVGALFLTSASATAIFLRTVSEFSGWSGGKVFWVYFTTGKLPKMSFLRPDANFVVVLLEREAKSAKVYLWNGIGFAENFYTWKFGDKRLNPTVIKRPKITLGGHSLSVAVFKDPPFVSVQSRNESKLLAVNDMSGWLVELWTDLQNQLNFCTSFYQPSRQSGGLFKRAVEELTSGRADVVLGPFALIHGDSKHVDFTFPVTTLHYKFVVPRVSATSSINQFLQPFSSGLWKSIVSILTLAVILITTAYMIGQKLGFELPGRPLYGFYESALIIYGSVLAQGPDFSPRSISARTVLWTSYAFGVVICQAYAASLTSKLTLGILQPPFKNLEGMLTSSYTPIIIVDSAPHRLISSADTGAWKELRDRRPYPRVVSDMDAALSEVSNPWSYATLLEASERLLPKIRANCKLSLVPGEVARIPAGLMISKMSPLKQAFDQKLALMSSSGQLSRLKSKWVVAPQEVCSSSLKGLPRFDMENVALPFYILLAAFCLGLLILFAEFLIKKWLWDQLRPLEFFRQIAANVTRGRETHQVESNH